MSAAAALHHHFPMRSNTSLRSTMNNPTLAIALLFFFPHVSSFAYYYYYFTGPSPSSMSISSSSTHTSRLRYSYNIRDRYYLHYINSNCISNTFRRPLYLSANDDDDSTNAGAIIGGDLVTSLARLDREWKLARQSSSRKKIGDWVILNLMSEDNNNDNDDDSTTTPSTPEIVYLLEPSSGSTPSCIIFFLGGAVLGQFPHIAYSTFCQKLATKMNASVVAIPYEVGLDHFGIAQQAVKRMKSALIECEDSRGYPTQLPKYAIGHSLGAKLHSISIAATGIGDEFSGVGFVAYNNFGFAETITMARSFMKELQPPRGGSGSSSSTPFDALFDLAGMAVSAVGLEFTPSPTDMDTILRSKFDEEVLTKIRLFRFEDDDLDSTNRFLGCFVNNDEMAPSVSYLPGTHLTPVFLKLGLDDLPDEAREMASQVTGGFQNASFGNEGSLDTLVDEISEWMLGLGPNDRREPKKQISGVMDAEVVEE